MQNNRIGYGAIAVALMFVGTMQCVNAQVIKLDAAKAEATKTDAAIPSTPAATTTGAAVSPAKPAAPAAARPAASEKTLPALPLFIVQFLTGPSWAADKAAGEQAGFREHSQNLSRLRSSGTLLMGGRFKDSVADKGMLIVRAADKAAVVAEFAADPMITGKQFILDIAEFQPFYDGFVARTARVGAAPESPLNALTWLAGCWSGRTGKIEFREHWMRPLAGVMQGMGRTISEGKLLSYEAMRIEVDASGKPVFTAKPSDKPEASFKSVRFDAESVEFENPKHDFPQRIRYMLKTDGTLEARIEGNMNGREARVEFPMRRVSCE